MTNPTARGAQEKQHMILMFVGLMLSMLLFGAKPNGPQHRTAQHRG
ncbi:hypothetical protein [Pseudarthrobacter sulfonivorans]|nr:hypothetical protein [Pseudarthrobacter sulfonivorans]MDR6413300.1 hypothetical protein [Pseudarthrobacter sulfonivorans]